MSLLSRRQQLNGFTIDRDTATFLAAKLASGHTTELKFQSLGNRNWVAKMARTRFGMSYDQVKVYTTHDVFINPSDTVEAKYDGYTDNHWMTVYTVEINTTSYAPNTREDDLILNNGKKTASRGGWVYVG